MEVQTVLASQRAKIDVHRSPESVPADASARRPSPRRGGHAGPDPFRGCLGRGVVRVAQSGNEPEMRTHKDHTTIKIETATVGRTQAAPEAASPLATPPIFPPNGSSNDVSRRNLEWASAYSFALQDLTGIDLSLRRSMAIFGTRRPTLIAKMIATAVMPSASVSLMSASVVCEPSASCTRPLAILNRKTPGIIETTEAKPMAANGMCQRCATGVRISPTTKQTTKAPIAALEPSTVMDHHLRAWASMPAATRHGSMCSRAVKKTL